MNVVPEKKNLESGLKLTWVTSLILIKRGAPKTICFFSLTVKEIFCFVSSVQMQKSLSVKSLFDCLVFSLHEGCTSLDQERWIYTATDLATNGFTKNKNSWEGWIVAWNLDLFVVLLKMSPDLVQKHSRQAKKKKACTHTYFFSNGSIKMT